jgi:hypothetical protein
MKSWHEGEIVGYRTEVEPPGERVGDRIVAPNGECFVVAERWKDQREDAAEWHIVLRRPDTPAECTPPWERNGEG